jgi:hypothetical protein
MKSKITRLTVIALTGMFSFNGCDKLKDELFKAFSAKTNDVKFTINIVSDTTQKVDIGTISTNLNLDSIIKAETDNAFSLSSVKSVKMESCVLTLLDADPSSNFANFEEGWVIFSTNSNPSPVTVATGPNPDVYSDSLTLPVDPGAELKGYLSGNTLAYIISAKARRPTTKTLNCKMSVKFRIE